MLGTSGTAELRSTHPSPIPASGTNYVLPRYTLKVREHMEKPGTQVSDAWLTSGRKGCRNVCKASYQGPLDAFWAWLYTRVILAFGEVEAGE